MSWNALPLFVRLEGRPVILLGDGDAAAAKRALLVRGGAVISGENAADARFAIVANGDEAAVARLKARGVLVNVPDRPELCDFLVPAIVDRDPVLVAIGTGGASAGLAAALRQRLEAILPAGLGGLAVALGAMREALHVRFADASARRRALSDALREGGALDLLREGGSVMDWVAGAASEPARLVRFALTSDDPEELTLRQARALAQADRVYHRADVPNAILDRARADAVRIVCDAAPEAAGAGLSVELEMAR